MGNLDNHLPSTYRSSAIGKAIKWLIILLVLVLIATAVGLFLGNNYLESNKTKILKDLPFLNKASISFEEADISLFKNFPSVSLIIHQLKVKDSLFHKHQQHLLEVDALSLSFSLEELLKKKITIQSVHLEKGTVRWYRDETGYSNLKALLPDTVTDPKNKGELELLLNGLDVKLSDLAVHITDDSREMNIHGHVDHLETVLNIDREQVMGALDFAVNVQELSFKKESGSFVENSKVKGLATLRWKDKLLEIDPFELKINEEIFELQGTIPTDGKLADLILVNQNTRFDKVVPLLSRRIRDQLTPYQIADPFYTKTLIKTDFKPNSIPLVKIDFKMDDNNLVVFDRPLKNTFLTGKFVNSLDENTQELITERGRMSLIISELTTEYNSFFAKSKELIIKNTRGKRGDIISDITVTGPVSEISQLLKNDQFFFEKGTFELTANLNGSIKDMDDLIIHSNARLFASDFSVFYQPANSAFSFKKMELVKEAGNGFFSIVNNSITDGSTINIDGGLTNLPALLLDAYLKQVSSEVNITSSKLTWQNFLNLFGKNGYLKRKVPKTDLEKKYSMKETLKGIYENFQPKLTIQIDTLEYLDQFQLINFKSGLYFKNAHELALEETAFDYDVGHVTFSGTLDINHPSKTPFDFQLVAKKINLSKLLPVVNYFNIPMLKDMDQPAEDVSIQIKHKGIIDDEVGLVPNTSTGNIAIQNKENKLGSLDITYYPIYELGSNEATSTMTKISLEGDPIVFNDFFKTDKFIFKEGFFKVTIEHDGALDDVKNLLEQGTIDFLLVKGEVFYQPIGITFPLASIDLEVEDNNAIFDFVLQSDSLQRELQFSGNLENLTELVVGNTGEPLNTLVNIYSPLLDWKEFRSLFTGGETSEENNTIESMKATISDLLNTFNPRIHIDTDTFFFKENLIVEGATTGIYLLDSTTVYLEKTGFHFYDGSMLLNGSFDLSPLPHTPFDFNIHTKNFDVAGLLKSLDYLALPTLEQAEKLRGDITMNLDLKGTITEDGKGLVTNDTKGILNFELHNLEMKGFEPLHTIGEKVRMKHRFEDVRFAPITNQAHIYKNNIGFPQMEIQSNAFHFFIEGVFSFGTDTNMWLSFPLNNLRKKKVSIIPAKTGYAAHKRKVYLEITSDEKGDLGFDFYLSKRKFYKDRGFLHKYRSDKKRDRAIRKETRKKRRSMKK